MSAAPSTSKSNNGTSSPSKPAEAAPATHLGVLEEDDEFEEFPVSGQFRNKTLKFHNPVWDSDWNDAETDLAHLGAAAPGAAKSGGDKLWEDNWDDDDIEDEFSLQLRAELEKTKAASMEH